MDAVDAFGLVGTVLEGKYRVDRCVAAGGFGSVYAAHHLRLDVPIALKVLRADRLQDASVRGEFVARFLAEARTTARLVHAHIARVYDSGIAYPKGFGDGVPWIVLEWIEGVTLEQKLAERGRGHSPSEALTLLEPLLEAVAHAHSEGIAHRDLKPGNVMLGTHGLRVLDFGIAKSWVPDTEPSGETSTDSATIAFSPAYAAPEQVTRSRTGPWTDVHALGLILTEMLTGRYPYAGAGTEPTLSRAVDPRRPTPARAGVDVGPWGPVIARALALRPPDRQRDAAELLADLRATVAAAEAAYAGSAHGSATETTALAKGALDTTVAVSAPSFDSVQRTPFRRIGLVIAAVLVAGLAAILTTRNWPDPKTPTVPSAVAPVHAVSSTPSAPSAPALVASHPAAPSATASSSSGGASAKAAPRARHERPESSDETRVQPTPSFD